jgi:hypothetical protein
MGADERVGVVDLRENLLVAATKVPNEVINVQCEPNLRVLMLVGMKHA